MQVTQTRAHKGKASPKTASTRGQVGAPKLSKGDSKNCPVPMPSISAEERQNLIARAAYFRAEKRGFSPGCELQDWFEAEMEVTKLIGGA